MNVNEFRNACNYVIALIIKHNQNIQYMDVFPDKQPGYMKNKFPPTPPKNKQDIFNVLRTLETKIIPSLTNWNHPQFYAYFPCGNGYPSILAEMLITGLGSLGCNWDTCPALTELEILVLDMFGRLLNLPQSLLFEESGSRGGGMIQNSASEAIHSAMLVARNRTLLRLRGNNEDINPMRNLHKLVAYFSLDAHSSMEKAARLLQVEFKLVAISDDGYSMTGEEVEKLIIEDKRKGLVPFFVGGVMGTTGTAAIDDFVGLSDVIKNHPEIWYHIDAAYGGSALMLQDFNYLLPGIQNVDSINCNPYKWCLVAPDGAAMWVKDRAAFRQVFQPTKKFFSPEDDCAANLSNQSISYSRRFRVLRLWFTLRVYGKRGLQAYLQNHRNLAKRFAHYIINDPMFVLMNKVQLGLVCFRVKETQTERSEDLTVELLARLNETKKIHLIPSKINDIFFIRLSVNYEFASENTIDFAWDIIHSEAKKLIDTPSFKKHQPEQSFIKDSIDGLPLPKSIDFGDVVIEPSQRR